MEKNRLEKTLRLKIWTNAKSAHQHFPVLEGGPSSLKAGGSHSAMGAKTSLLSLCLEEVRCRSKIFNSVCVRVMFIWDSHSRCSRWVWQFEFRDDYCSLFSSVPSWEARAWKNGARRSLLMTPPASFLLFSHSFIDILCHLRDNAILSCKYSRKCLTASHPLTIQLKKMFHEVLLFKKMTFRNLQENWSFGSKYLTDFVIILTKPHHYCWSSC